MDPYEDALLCLHEELENACRLLEEALTHEGSLAGARLEVIILSLEEGLLAARTLDAEVFHLLRVLLQPLWRAAHACQDLRGENLEHLHARGEHLRAAVRLARGLPPADAPPLLPAPSWDPSEEDWDS